MPPTWKKKWWSKCVLNYIVLTSQSIWHFDESNRIIQNVDPNFQKEFIMLQLLFSYISEVIVVISPLLNMLGNKMFVASTYTSSILKRVNFILYYIDCCKINCTHVSITLLLSTLLFSYSYSTNYLN